MIEVYAIADGVPPIKPVVPRVENHKERTGREKPFPPLPGDESQEEPTNERENEPPTEEKREESSDHQIDIHVAGVILPTRQMLPPPITSRTLH